MLFGKDENYNSPHLMNTGWWEAIVKSTFMLTDNISNGYVSSISV